MVCPIAKIDSNITGLSFAEEVCLGQLPNTVDDGFEPTWYNLEPNSYSDFGGEVSTVARAPIDPSRQNKKGVVTDLDASGGFNHDYVKDPNFSRLLQGFFFADIRQKPTTIPMNAAKINVTSATAATDVFATSATAVAFNLAGLLVKASGFGQAANNTVHRVVSADGAGVTVGNGLVDEGAPPATAKLQVVGYEAATADFAITVTGNVVRLTSGANVLASLGLIPGEWIFIGGDTLADNRFANNVGFARILTVSAGALVFDDVTWSEPVAETSTGKEIRIWFGDVLKNENTRELIKRRSYQLERTLGEGENGTQAEYLEGAVSNEFALNIPQAEKITADLTFVATDNSHRSGDVDDEIKSSLAGATVVAAIGADAANSTSNVYRLKMNILDPTTSTPSGLFGYVTEATLSINNGVTPNKAIGVLGAFDTSAGNFVVSGSIDAYFQTIAAVRAVRQNADVNFNMIVTAENEGFVYDIPLLGLGGGRLNVEKDQPIKVPLEPQAAMCALGYTLLHNEFHYLPDVAMSQAA